MYKVFFYQHKILIGNKKDNPIEFDQEYQYTTSEKLNHFLYQELLQKSGINVLIYHEDLKLVWKAFKNQFKVKRAAGGLVYNKNNEWLFIKRRGKWDLPKGHIEKQEPKPVAAIREVTEECGIDQLIIEQKLIKTYHSYLLKGRHILKPSTWYLMQYNGTTKGEPQLEEDITEVKWVKAYEVPGMLKNSFGTIADVWNKANYKTVPTK